MKKITKLTTLLQVLSFEGSLSQSDRHHSSTIMQHDPTKATQIIQVIVTNLAHLIATSRERESNDNYWLS